MTSMLAIVDNYDSFTYNLVDRLARLGCENVDVVRNDALTVSALAALGADGILISPGPGHPASAGISCEVIRRLGPTTPILGVCLGHQAIAEAFGGVVRRARRPKHGMVSEVTHEGDGLFEGLPAAFPAVRYHSLAVDAAAPGVDINPIAWALDDGEIMAVRHAFHPIWGVQFHPESIGTAAGEAILGNFVRLARGALAAPQPDRSRTSAG
jgi:anthranilate synthase component 2